MELALKAFIAVKGEVPKPFMICANYAQQPNGKG
jgi:hypothetical protein